SSPFDNVASPFVNAASSSNPTGPLQYQQDNDDGEDDAKQHQGGLRRGVRVRHAPTCGIGGHLGDDGGGHGHGRGRGRGRDS
ncbi:hypothetical protein A2U01_0076818, partial [Trifolium medium]|nr:hypothetical protein [Trifolium medium]